jgi:hypothetical protein
MPRTPTTTLAQNYIVRSPDSVVGIDNSLGNGGEVLVRGGHALGGGFDGGDIFILGGNPDSGGAPGNAQLATGGTLPSLVLRGGASSAAVMSAQEDAGLSDGGYLAVYQGSTTQGATVVVQAGDGLVGSVSGGDVEVYSGNASVAGRAGDIRLLAGDRASGLAGSIVIKASNATVSAAPGAVQIDGALLPGIPGGSILVGAALPTTGGNLDFFGGNTLAGSGADGGVVNIGGGAADAATGTGGNVAISGGSGLIGGDVVLTPGSGPTRGALVLDYSTWPGTEGTPGYILSTDGAGTLSWVADSGATTLQSAYVGGNTITTSSADGDFTVTGTEAISLGASSPSNFTVVGSNLTLATTTAGNVVVTSAASVTVDAVVGFSIDGAAASNLSTTGANLTLSTISSGTLAVSSAGVLDLDAGPGSNATLNAGSSGAGSGGNVEVTAGSGNAAGTISITGGAAIGAATDGGQVTITGGAGAGTGAGGDVRLAGGSGTSTVGLIGLDSPTDRDGVGFKFGTISVSSDAGAFSFTFPTAFPSGPAIVVQATWVFPGSGAPGSLPDSVVVVHTISTTGFTLAWTPFAVGSPLTYEVAWSARQ